MRSIKQTGLRPQLTTLQLQEITMFEIIWSVWNDKYIVRPVPPMGNVKPVFIGTEEECAQKIKNCSPH